MSLMNRLSLFFLATLAVVLAGFSLTLYLLFRMQLYSELDDRVQAAMEALVAAVEVHPQDVQWEPLERQITVGADAAVEQPRWTLRDLSGQLKDRSSNLTSGVDDDLSADGWRVLVRRMRAGNFLAEPIDGREGIYGESTADTPLGSASSTSLPDDRTFTSDGLVLTVVASTAPVAAMLRRLALILIIASTVTWCAAALWGRWLCRRALQPIHEMASSARSIRREDAPTPMLTVPSTRDELEDLGRAFNELLLDLRESLERQRRFAGDASHQLRTPLTALLASVEVVLRHDRSAEEYQRVLGIVLRRGGELRQIIESLLFLARADGGSQLGPRERIELNGWSRTWLDAWAGHPRANDFAFRAATAPALVTTHPALLGQVLDNLLDNACKYSEPGTRILVEVETTSRDVGIAVSDSGSGIAQDQQPMIFEPFFRDTEARWHGKSGSGLGLAIVRRLVDILGARIEVQSELNKGSRFRVLMPAEHDVPARQEDEDHAVATGERIN